MQLNINTDAAVVFTNKLEKISRSALPVTIRQSLDSAAFDVKQRTLLKVAKSTFKERDKNFFKATSFVEKAKGFNVNSMKSIVGFGNNKISIKQTRSNLEKQEDGGRIGGRAFIPIDSIRVGKKDKGVVRTSERLGDVKSLKFLDSRDNTAKSDKQKFIRTALQAKIRGNGLVLGNHRGKKGFRTLSRIESIRVGVKTKKLKIVRTALFSVKGKHAFNVDRTDFMKRASNESGLKIEQFYIANAKRNILKYTK